MVDNATETHDTRSTNYRRPAARSTEEVKTLQEVHRAHRAIEKAEIASGTLDGALLLVVNFARASSWSVKIAAEQVLPEN